MQVAGFGPEGLIDRSLSRPNQPKGTGLRACGSIGRPDGPCIHTVITSESERLCRYFHGSGSGSGAAPNQKLPRDG
jgi:hypothetical protein